MKKRVKYISATQIACWLECPKAYVHIYVDHAQRMPPNEYIIYGSAMHEALAFNYQQKITSAKDLSAGTVIDFFKQSWGKKISGAALMGHESLQNILLKGETVLEAYMDEVAPAIQPKLVESRFNLPLKSLPITIYGFIDLVDVNDLIIDHKNIGKQSKADWRRKEKATRTSVQLTMYSAAFRKMFNRLEKGVAFDYMVRAHEPEYIRMQTTRSDNDVLSVLQLAARIEDALKKDFFYANLNNCENCDFRESCDRMSY